LAEAVADAQLRHRRLIRSLTVGSVEFNHIPFPAQVSGAHESADQPPPTLGQNTRELLQELDFQEEEINALKIRGTISD